MSGNESFQVHTLELSETKNTQWASVQQPLPTTTEWSQSVSQNMH